MDYDDNDAEHQNLPKFEFDDSLQGNLRFDSLVENEVFLGITSQEDDHWIEEYSRGTTSIQFTSSAVESTRKNVWSEATSSESVEMLLKSVGQEEKVLEGSLTNVMDPNFQSQHTQVSGSEEKIDKICDDELQEYPSLSKVECRENPQEVVNNSSIIENVGDHIVKNEDNNAEIKIPIDSNMESLAIEDADATLKIPDSLNKDEAAINNAANVHTRDLNDEIRSVEPDVNTTDQGFTPDSPNKDETAINNAPNVDTRDSNDETRSIEPDVNTTDQDFTFIERTDAILPLDFRDIDMDVVEPPSLSAEGFEVVTTMAQGSESNMDIQTDAVTDNVESSGMSSFDTTDDVTEDQPRSPILGVSLLHDYIEEKAEMGFSGEESSQKRVPQVDCTVDCPLDGPLLVVEKDTVSDGDEEVVHELAGHCDPCVDNLNAGPSEQTAEDNSEGLLDPKESITGKDEAEPLNLAVTPVESNEIPSLETPDGVHLSSETVVTTDDVTEEDQPRSPIFGVSLLHDDVEEKVEVGFASEDSSQKRAPLVDSTIIDCALDGDLRVVEKDAVSDGDEEVVHELTGHCDPCVDNLNAGPSEQTREDNSESLVDLKESVTGEDEEEPLNLAVAAVESSEISSLDGVHLPSGTVVTTDDVTEADNEEKVEVGFTSEDSSQKRAPQVDSTMDCALDGALTVLEKEAVSDHELADRCDPRVGNLNAGPSEQTAEDNSGSLLDLKESLTREDGVEPLNLAVNMSDEQQATVDLVGPSERDADRVVQNVDGPPSLDKPQILSFSDTQSTELLQIAKEKHEKSVSSSSATKEERSFTFDVSASSGQSPPSLDKPQILSFSDTQSTELLQIAKDTYEKSVSSISATKEEKSFTFDVSASAGQSLSLSMNTKMSSVSSVGSQLEPIKLHEDSLVSPQTPSGAATASGAKVNSERKPRKKSVDKETAKKGNQTTPTRRSRQVEKSPTLLTTLAIRHVTPGKELKPVESVECSNQKPSTSIIPDLNNSTSLFHQPFSDNQQVQLRAQIMVYGSLISAVPPEEPHMVAAFGNSDGGRRAWEAVWHACLERVRAHKSQPNNHPSTPIQSRSGNKDPDQRMKIGISSPIVSPVISISSPLWNISTPCDASQSRVMPRSALFDYHQAFSPRNHYQTPRVHNFPGHNPPWLPQSPFPGPWVASSPINASFNARFSSLPITEAVKLTTLKESGGPDTSVVPVDPSAGQTVSIGQPSTDSKSRKRKKAAASVAVTDTWAPHFSTSAALSTPVFVNSKTVEKAVTREETVSKIEESKVQADDAAVHAAAAVSHFQDVWSQLEIQKNSGLISDDEAKLASSAASIAAASIAAASAVAKVAAAAAKIASNVAEEARLMADEVFQSNKTENRDQNSTISVISVAKEAARRRIEAASAASKHAENLDAIVKAAELAAEAVTQAGKIVAMGKPLTLRELVEGGPDGYWKKSQLNVGTVTNDLVKNQMMIIDGTSGQIASYETDKSIETGHKKSDVNEDVAVIPELEIGSVRISDVDQDMTQSTSDTWKENVIKEGCLVEVYKDDNEKKGGWYTANVLTLKDGRAYLCYTEIQSDEGQTKEWVPLEVEGSESPRIRIAHPATILRFEGTKKRSRTALTDYAWCSGDRVDVWVHNRWCEAVVADTNKIDITSLTVKFLAQEETSVVRSWHVRPTLIWKDDKWIEWSNLKGSRSFEGDTPHEKRQKFGSPVVEDNQKKIVLKSVDLIDSERHQVSKIFNIGKSSTNENKLDTRKTTKTGLQKKPSRVVFGIPTPGKKQKFMDVSTQFVANGSNKNITRNDSVKVANYLMPRAPRGSKNISRNDSEEKQVAEIKSKIIKSRKPPVPSIRSLAQKDKSKIARSHDSVSVDEKLSGQQNRTDSGSSSNADDAKESLTSKNVFQRLNKVKMGHGDRKESKVEVKEKSTPEVEPRRSNRRIQPTSRLLEGLQSSLTISKTPSASHASQRSHNKGTPKGSTNPG